MTTLPRLPADESSTYYQSPVDIRPQAVDTGPLPALRFDHPARTDLSVRYSEPDRSRRAPTEATVRAEPPPGRDFLLTVGAGTYRLADVHWHTPSEHTVGGVTFPLEQHMKYVRADDGDQVPPEGEPDGGGHYAVVAAFVHPGDPNPALDRLLCAASKDTSPHPVPDVEFDALLPACTESYRYTGSTTAYPYLPGVRWHLLTHPVQATAAAIAHYRSIFPDGDARAVQPLGRRRIHGDRHRWW
ncbi:carbonic anhydrase family protein [Streptomyces sp. NPDC004134]|uniref:carbonic anhydrase family protein n=1 Tax=Streptomyces sp. NPDC004134 TaxID=3364691 RepID=UPI0036C26C4C